MTRNLGWSTTIRPSKSISDLFICGDFSFSYFHEVEARDDLSVVTTNLVNELIKWPDCFSYGLDRVAGNNLYLNKLNGLHQTLIARFLYNAFQDGLLK